MDCYDMTQHEVSIIVLEAGEGMILTDGETYAKVVYLGVNDSPDRWYEVPETEAGEEELQ